jgi:ectoine hydroxylase-related dioxygenase (phytanoyl-CoA dioxygenase family)
VKQGDVLVHNCNTIHRAGKNSSLDRRRRAIGIVCIPYECTIDPRLEKYHQDRLKEDIEYQRIKNPKIFNDMKAKYQA